ncbi:hypothetical protein ACLB2K_075089 [Fragaria x ananassa]
MDSDEEAIGEEYNSDGDEVRYPEFNPKVDMENPWFCKGMLFATPEILRATITERAIQKGWEPLYSKSDRSRLRVICKAEDCEFELFASRMQHSNTFQIKTYQGNHNCARVQENCAVRVPYLVRKFSNFIKMNPNITTDQGIEMTILPTEQFQTHFESSTFSLSSSPSPLPPLTTTPSSSPPSPRVHVEDGGGGSSHGGNRAQDQKVGIEEQFAQMTVGLVGQQKQDDGGGFVVLSSPA